VGHEGGGPRNVHAGVLSMALSPDGKTLATSGYDGTIRLWETLTGKDRGRLEGTGTRGGPDRSVTFAPDGKTLAASSVWGEILLWDAATRRRLRVTDEPDMGACRVAVSPDGKILATAGWQQTLELWDARTGRRLGALGSHEVCSGVAFSPDGAIVASGGS